MRLLIAIACVVLCACSDRQPAEVPDGAADAALRDAASNVDGAPDAGATPQIINAPYFSGPVVMDNTAVATYGAAGEDVAFTDVRVGYDDSELWMSFNVRDRQLWYDPSLNDAPNANDVAAWDGVSVQLTIGGTTYRFDAQMTWWEPRANYQAAFVDGSPKPLAFTTASSWRGDAPNDTSDDRGHQEQIEIPWATLGLAGKPADGTAWPLQVVTHDRSCSTGCSVTDLPKDYTLRFGLPTYVAPQHGSTTTTVTTTTGTTVNVGGYTLCGGSLDLNGTTWWNDWGNTAWGPRDYLNPMNESDVSDWPCFNEVYAEYPLPAIPPGKVIVSASMTLYEFGTAGDPGQTLYPSWVQIYELASAFDAATIRWNSKPDPIQNVSGTTVDVGGCGTTYTNCPAYQWDVSQPVANAYAASTPLRFVLYDADSHISSGKYFFSATSGETQWRPQLAVTYADP